MAISAEEVRSWLSDYPDGNLLLDDVQFPTERIVLCLKLAIADFNTTPVFTAYAAETFPFPTIAAHGCAAYLYEGESVKQTRNHLPYATGSISIDDQNKGPAYAEIAARFRNKFEKATRDVKNFLNLEQGWGSVGSEYRTLGYY